LDLDAEHRALVSALEAVERDGHSCSALCRAVGHSEILGNMSPLPALSRQRMNEETTMGRGILLWLLGVPIPVIILLWLFFGR
jgi:hypothetical protein